MMVVVAQMHRHQHQGSLYSNQYKRYIPNHREHLMKFLTQTTNAEGLPQMVLHLLKGENHRRQVPGTANL
jgi:hypothetical protein